MSILKAFRILTGTVRQNVILFAAALSVTAAFGVAKRLAVSDFVTGFIEGFVPLFTVVAVMMSSLSLILVIFNANEPSAVGYKYYRSLPRAAETFRKALIFADIFAVAQIAVFGAAEAFLFGHKLMIFTVSIGAFIVGLLNFLGFCGSSYVRLIPFVFAGGLAGGFGTALITDDGELKLSPLAAAIVVTAAVAVCAAGIAFALFNSKRAWEKEERQCAD